MKKVFVIGSGGREHAIAKAFCQSEQVEKVWVAPGNPGMLFDTKLSIDCVPIRVDEIEKLVDFVVENHVDLTFVGPEIPLNLGVVDAFRKKNLAIIGPTKEASQLEASKGFAKDLMQRANVPTARYQRFTSNERQAALDYLQTFTAPYVIKEDGLAAGKGVIIAETYTEAVQAVESMLKDNNGQIVIEEFLSGEEFSYFCLVNEEHIIYVGNARDYKRAFDGDLGLNTGGMGAFSPVPFVTETIEQQVNESIIRPLLAQMVQEGVPYTGVLYAGLMLTEQGPKVIEFNARFGDPETQILLPRINHDFYSLCESSLNKEEITVELSHEHSLGVVFAAEGYPQSYPKGMKINFSDPSVLSSICFSGVQIDDSQLIADGGRILMMTAQGNDLMSCREQVYQQLATITCDSTFYRKDIGKTFI